MQICPNGNPFICQPGFNPRGCNNAPADDMYVRLFLYFPWTLRSITGFTVPGCQWEYEWNSPPLYPPSWDSFKQQSLRGVHLNPYINGWGWPEPSAAWTWQAQPAHYLQTSLGQRAYKAGCNPNYEGATILAGMKRVPRTTGGHDILITGGVGYYHLPAHFNFGEEAGGLRNVIFREGTHTNCCPWMPGTVPYDYTYTMADIVTWQGQMVCQEAPVEQVPLPPPAWEQYTYLVRETWAIQQTWPSAFVLSIHGYIVNHSPTDFELQALYERTQSLFQLIRNNPGSWLRVSLWAPNVPIGPVTAGIYTDTLRPPVSLPTLSEWTPTADDTEDFIVRRNLPWTQYFRLEGWVNGMEGNNWFCQNAYQGPFGGACWPDGQGDVNNIYECTYPVECQLIHQEPLV